MLTKINRKECFEAYPLFPWSDNYHDKFFFPKTHRELILSVEAKSVTGQAKKIADSLFRLITEMQYESLIFLGDNKRAWLYQNNEYKPAKAALQYLIDYKINKTFNGAIKVESTNLFEFIKHLFPISRFNAALPTFYFMDPGQNMLGSICQYGNVHLYTLNMKTDRLINDKLKGSGFIVTDKCQSYPIKVKQTIL